MPLLMTKGDSGAMDAWGWVPPTAVGIGGSIAGWLLAWRVNSARNEQDAINTMKRLQEFRESTDKGLQDLKEDFRAGMNEIRALADAGARLQSSQSVVNALNAKALDAITAKQDQQSEKLSDHSSTIKLLMELVPMLRQQCEDLRKQMDGQPRAVGFEK